MVMRKVLMGSALFALMVGCASGTVKEGRNGDSKTVNVSRNYTELEIGNVINAVYSDTADKLTISCADELLPYVVVKDREGKLEIYLDTRSLRKRSFTNGAVDVVVPSSSSLQKVEIYGASKFSSQKPMTSAVSEVEVSGASRFEADIVTDRKLSVDLSGASKMVAGVNAGMLELDLSGASMLELDGNAEFVDLDLSGASKLDMKQSMKVSEVKVDMSGASKAVVNADKRITGDLSGASKLEYSGDAQVNVESSGFSSVSRR